MSSQASATLDILFFGDLVGRPGRNAVKWYLSSLAEADKPDVVIANVENASHGFGLSESNYRELQQAGIDIMTSGNHIWDRKDIFEYVHNATRLLRPANFPQHSIGRGAGIFEIKGHKIGVLNLIGQVFMSNYNSPWEALEASIPMLREETPILFIDIHAEATAEKVCLARQASTMGVSAVVGTHTHVQTADEKILNNRTGYLTDAGFCGAYESVIGMLTEPAITRLKTMYPAKLDVPDTSLVQVNGVRYTIDTKMGACIKVSRVNVVRDLEEPPYSR